MSTLFSPLSFVLTASTLLLAGCVAADGLSGAQARDADMAPRGAIVTPREESPQDPSPAVQAKPLADARLEVEVTPTPRVAALDGSVRPVDVRVASVDTNEAVVGPLGRLASEAKAGGLPGPKESCHGLKGENKLLPGTNVRYCVGAHPDCKNPGAACPLYVTFNATGAYFKKLLDPARWGKFITVESRQDFEGATIGDPFAELPRVIARDYPGLDESRIFAVGNSRGGAAITRPLCRASFKSDESTYGTVTDVYAGVAVLGICPICDDGFMPKTGNIHFLIFDGADDTIFAKDHCEGALRKMAQGYKCKSPQGAWCNVAADDGIVKQGDGTDKVRKMTVGTCGSGALVAYMARDEGHIASATKNFSPPLSGYDMAWDFFQNKRKIGGDSSAGRQCAAP